MRVIAGELRGRRLASPPGRTARPATDRVREAIFNSLQSQGALEDARVLDLFAGSGAMGIEALSRGARHVTFVERDRAVRRTVERNLDALGLGARTRVVGTSADRFLEEDPGWFDVALLDPPYAFDDWVGLIARVRARVLVVRSDREIPMPVGWGVLKEQRYGGTLVMIVERMQSSSEEASEESPEAK